MVLQVAQQGLTWGALGQSITPDFPFSGRGVFIVVAADIFIYALLTAYLDQVGRWQSICRQIAVALRETAPCCATKELGQTHESCWHVLRGRRHPVACKLQSTLASTTSCTRSVFAGSPANRQA